MSEVDITIMGDVVSDPFAFKDHRTDAREEYKELIAAAKELSDLSAKLMRVASFYTNPGALKNFELHSKEHRHQELVRLSELVDGVEDSGKGFYKKLKRVKRTKVTPELVDKLLNQHFIV